MFIPMGMEDRDWYGDTTSKERSFDWHEIPGFLIVLVVVGGLVLAWATLRMTNGPQPTFEGESRPLKGDSKISLLPGLPSITLRGDSLYWPNDKWTAYLADEQTCPGGESTDLPLAQQADTMVCLVNYARKQRGLSQLTTVAVLNGSSIAKAERVVRCKEFKHAACGQHPASDARAAGYRGSFGENLYIATGRYGSPRIALDGWLNSPGHRENLFRPEWRTQGIAIRKIDRFGKYLNAALWVNEFGTG